MKEMSNEVLLHWLKIRNLELESLAMTDVIYDGQYQQGKIDENQYMIDLLEKLVQNKTR